tara:strand:- start:19137 stop:19346 length:210 start_codon:yes stop_codon:yes gene_type:complete
MNASISTISPTPPPTISHKGLSPPKSLNNTTKIGSSPLNPTTPPMTPISGGTKKYKKRLKQKRSRKYSR